MPGSQFPLPSPSARLRIYEIGCATAFLIGLAALALVYLGGRSMDWSAASFEGIPSETAEVKLLGGGQWLTWYDAEQAVFGAADLDRPGQAIFLRPPPNLRLKLVDVIGNDLLALIVRPEFSFMATLHRGWRQLTGGEPTAEELLADVSSESARSSLTAFLERIDLSSGKVQASMPGGSFDLRERILPPTDFEIGKVAVSPDGLTLAWWRAGESLFQPAGGPYPSNPLSAKVTEKFDILSSGPNIKSLFNWEFTSDGSLPLRSRLLESIGQPFWTSSENCFVVSFVDSGSFIPFDCREGSTQAMFTIAGIQKSLAENFPDLIYEPESIHVVRGRQSDPPNLFAWSQTTAAIHLFLLDGQFNLAKHASLDPAEISSAPGLWLSQCEALLVSHKTELKLLAISPRGERMASFPLPPDWEDGFILLGESSKGDLLGCNKGLFFSATGEQGNWETMDVFR